jgi:hypothetical protein
MDTTQTTPAPSDAQPPIWKRALSYLWTHKKQLAAAVSIGVAAGKAGSGWLDIAYAAARALFGTP